MIELLPTVRYLIVCEDILTDPDNPRRMTLAGLISAIRSLEVPPYPLFYRELCVFLQFTECRGPADGRVEIQHADSGRVLFQTRTGARSLSGAIRSRSSGSRSASATASSKSPACIGCNSGTMIECSHSSPCC